MLSVEEREQYEPSYCLLEEAREFWDYAISNKVVYSLDPLKSDLDSGVHVAKEYLENNLWIECHLTFESEGHRHYVVLFEFDQAPETRRSVRKIKIHRDSAGRNPPMFVDVADSVQSPKKTTLDRSGIRSVVRLKAFNNLPCICGDSASLLLKPSDTVLVENIENGELCAVGIARSQLGEREDHLIQSRPEAVEQIPGDERNLKRNVFEFKLDAVAAIFNILLKREGVGFRFVEGAKFVPQRFKMFLRPFGFQVGIN
jgi:hypothetical protein